MPPRQPTGTVLNTDTDLPAPAQAAALTLGILTHTKTDSWHHLTNHPEAPKALADLFVSPEQWQVLAQWSDVVRIVRRKVGATPRVTVAVCVGCNEWIAITGGTAPSGCLMTNGCPGKYVKPKDASRARVPLVEAQARKGATAPVEQAANAGLPVDDENSPSFADAMAEARGEEQAPPEAPVDDDDFPDAGPTGEDDLEDFSFD